MTDFPASTMWYQMTARDGLLPFGRHGACADVDRHRPLDAERNDPVEARPAQTAVAAQAEHDTALILLRNAKSAEHHDEHERDDDPSSEHGRASCSQTRQYASPCPVNAPLVSDFT